MLSLSIVTIKCQSKSEGKTWSRRTASATDPALASACCWHLTPRTGEPICFSSTNFCQDLCKAITLLSGFQELLSLVPTLHISVTKTTEECRFSLSHHPRPSTTGEMRELVLERKVLTLFPNPRPNLNCNATLQNTYTFSPT